jgi:hypothetical protein
MKQTIDTVWQRRGTSWVWDEEARNQVCAASEVWSLRQFLQAVGRWPDDLPSNGNQALVVAGLEGCLDLMTPSDAEAWLGDSYKKAVLSFQDFYQGNAALVFWTPSGGARVKINAATDAVLWKCAAPFLDSQLEFGRLIWAEPGQYPQELLLREGAAVAGLYHGHIS